jgi:L-ascorbate metabolism protein UlaG (beta-lactamase superfamily)
MTNEQSDHFNGKKFFNPGLTSKKSFSDFLKWRMTSKPVAWPTWVENTVVPRLPERIDKGEAQLTFINHMTFLIQMRGLNLITDPVFSERASPVQWAGPKRVRAPGIALDKLPKIDVVLLSHNHYDHMDLISLKFLSDHHRPLIIVPLGNRKILAPAGISNVVELDWWQTYELTGLNSELAKITLVPAQHWSARGLFDRNEALWGGFVTQFESLRIYFAGDTGYGAFFKEVAQRTGPFDASLLPIGAYEPRWFMKDHHMNPDEAVMAHLDIQSDLSFATHFGTFQLTDEGIDDPPTALARAMKERGISATHFIVPEVGQTYRIRRTDQKALPIEGIKPASTL